MAFMLAALLLPRQEPVELIRRLASDRIEERDAAAAAIRKLGPDAIPDLERASRDKDPEVASRARRLRVILGVAARLTPNLKSAYPDLEVRLASGGDRAWTEVFLEAGAPDSPIRTEDLGGLFPEAIRGLESSEEAYRALREIARRKVVAAGEAVQALLEEEDRELCRAAAHTLLKLGWNQSSPQVIRLLDSPDPYKRRIPLWAFHGVDMKSLAPGILRLLDSESPETRLAALRAVGVFKLETAEPHLLGILASPASDDEVREAAGTALGRLATKDTVPAVLPLLDSKEERVRRGAATALAELEALETGPRLLELLRDPKVDVRTAAAGALGGMNALESAAPLLVLSREEDRDEDERLRILDALVEMRVKEAVPGLELLLESENPRIRERAIDGLGRLGAQESVVKIARFLREKAEDTSLLNVRASAACALGKLEAKEAIPLLKGSPEALCRMGVREAAQPLLEAVEGFLFGLRGGPWDEEDAEWAPLNALNALREPALWQKLRSSPVRGSWKGTTRELLARIAEQEGLALEVPETRVWKEDMWMLKGGRIRSRLGQVPVLDALEELLPGEPYAFVLEPGRIRVLPTRDALVLWKAWTLLR